MSRFTLRMDRSWEREILSLPQAREIVELHTADVAALAIKEAPRASATRGNWNSIKKHIEAMVTLYDQGWYGQVVVEFDRDVRHAMLQERGWRDRAGRRHPGRFYLKEALAKARIE
ncbi:hypothetical protein OG401_14290 [Kitasatospora purpeofusca]|uniref:hypothetical protein n=1 Tax=Kitasatospora purpeofusca TaxID=67352 RepID=UPI00225A922C|nr:hypothetical protein [Kitasatospora purpeofusca]MCX4685468.1 hypothetical protein [Kitasatospora purpeofusca]